MSGPIKPPVITLRGVPIGPAGTYARPGGTPVKRVGGGISLDHPNPEARPLKSRRPGRVTNIPGTPFEDLTPYLAQGKQNLRRVRPWIHWDRLPPRLTPFYLPNLVWELSGIEGVSFDEVTVHLAHMESLADMMTYLARLKPSLDEEAIRELAIQALFYVRSPYFTPPAGTAKDLNTDVKYSFGQVTKFPISEADAKKFFNWMYPWIPATQIQTVGSLKRGLMVYAGEHFVFVRAGAFIFGGWEYGQDGQTIIGAKFNGSPGVEHLETHQLVHSNFRTRRDIKEVADDLLAGRTPSHGHATAGYEWEGFAVEEGGELRRFPDIELLQGMFEVTIGDGEGNDIYYDPLKMLCAMARTYEWLTGQDKHKGTLNVTAGLPPSGTPGNTAINDQGGTPANWYIGAISRLFLTSHRRHADMNPVAREIMEQYAGHHGYRGVDEMLADHGDIRSWALAAAHLNIGLINTFNPATGRYEIDANLAVFSLDLFLSEVGVGFAQMLAASGPYYQGVVPLVDGGKVPLSTRFFLRNNLDTGGFFNEPYLTSERLLATYRDTFVSPEGETQLVRAVTDRVARGAVGEIQGDGRRRRTIHGDGRGRFEETGKADGRIEVTALDATAMGPRIRAMAVLQILADVVLFARREQIRLEEAALEAHDPALRDELFKKAKNYTVFTFTKELTGLRQEDVFGSAKKAVTDFMLNGANSDRARETADKLRFLITQFYKKYRLPGRQTQKEIALGAIGVFQKDVTFDELAQGRGTQGAAMRNLALHGFKGRPVTANEAMRILAAFQKQEAQFVLANQDNPAVLLDYAAGRAGFKFSYPPN